MAKPRVFVSSTFYDLRQIRADIELFLKEIGYEPILFERGVIPYDSEAPLEASAYSEVDRCDILVAIIGSRLGSASELSEQSITQNEIQRAVNSEKPIFVFVERDTLAEFKTWQRNKGKDIEFAFADSPRIYDFIQTVYQMKRNNPVFPFSYALEIVNTLREQFAGLFQDMLARRQSMRAQDILLRLQDLASSFESILQTYSNIDSPKSQTINELLLVNHPIFQKLQSITGAPYRIFFFNKGEMESWLNTRQWKSTENSLIWADDDRFFTYEKASPNGRQLLLISKDTFDQHGNLRMIHGKDWDENSVHLKNFRFQKTKTGSDLDDDIPF